jgi:Ribosomal protein S8
MDPISNMIVSIKNAGDAGRDSIVIPFSKLKHSVASILKEEGFVKNVEKKSKGDKHNLAIDLIVEGRSPKVKGVKRHSKPSKRIYRKASEIRPVKHGYGVLVLSTPQGIMAGYKAKKAGLGGEALFSIW